MADERTLYAGDLTTDQIGTRITATSTTGATVTDDLIEVRYFAPGIARDRDGASESDGYPCVWVRFKHVAPAFDERRFNSQDGGGFWLGHTSQVTVVR